MKNLVYNRQHLKEYFLYGVICALFYGTTVILFLNDNRYENFYYLYIGNAFFMSTIFYYAFRLLYWPYDKKRAVSMLIAGHMATLAGVVLSGVFIIIAWFFFFPHPGESRLAENILEHAGPGCQNIHACRFVIYDNGE
jgi:hypothetical protein